MIERGDLAWAALLAVRRPTNGPRAGEHVIVYEAWLYWHWHVQPLAGLC